MGKIGHLPSNSKTLVKVSYCYDRIDDFSAQQKVAYQQKILKLCDSHIIRIRANNLEAERLEKYNISRGVAIVSSR